MSDGFRVVPDEIRRMASNITEAVGDIAGLRWQKPGGDYGHPGVRTAWECFLEALENQVGTMHQAATWHSDNLHAAATHYGEVDIAAGKRLEDAIPGGGFAGGVLPDSLKTGDRRDWSTGISGGGRAPASSGGGSGFMDPNIVRRAQRLPPLPPGGPVAY